MHQIGPSQAQTCTLSSKDGKLENDVTIGNHPRLENIHPWDTICCYFHCHAK
jgi:hypothetical protein